MNDDEKKFAQRLAGYEKKFDDAMDDDLNTADALGAIFELVRDANVSVREGSSASAAHAALKSLTDLCSVLGFLTKEDDSIPENVAAMIKEREEARKNRDWKRSDELRDALKNEGYVVEDTKQGQKIRKNV